MHTLNILLKKINGPLWKITLDITPLGNVLGWKDATSFDEN